MSCLKSLSFQLCIGLGLVHFAVAQGSPAPASVPVSLATHDPSLTALSPGSVPVRRTTVAMVTQPSASRDGADASAPDPNANIHVKGLKGTLNRDDVHQTMEMRQPEFDSCIAQSRRTVRWVSGSIRFAFRVNGDGRVASIKPLSSNIGHRELEQCLTAAVLATQFPKPSGRATAEFSWGMSVEPIGGRRVDKLDPRRVKPVVRKHRRELWKACEIRRRRARFQITAYIAPNGNLLSAGALAAPIDDDKVDCVLEQLAKWHLPKPKHTSKLSFDLR